MYENYMYCGKTIPQWRAELRNQYSDGEIYRMIKDGCDIQLLLLRNAGIISVED